ncbi:hypothetical protein L2E82_01713 [Cichorium intybus]|uniref:Uncharacterized protein n=1 Tax=Cichorium intybus TaxID=13427 RepID=A0ACB9H169_CICIN|nr:hypothetical protein L2E82_01713 [Cichorium intybus]
MIDLGECLEALRFRDTWISVASHSLATEEQDAPETLAHEAMLELRNEKALVHNLKDIDDEYDDDGILFLDNEPILDSESDFFDSDDPNRNNDDSSFE